MTVPGFSAAIVHSLPLGGRAIPLVRGMISLVVHEVYGQSIRLDVGKLPVCEYRRYCRTWRRGRSPGDAALSFTAWRAISGIASSLGREKLVELARNSLEAALSPLAASVY